MVIKYCDCFNTARSLYVFFLENITRKTCKKEHPAFLKDWENWFCFCRAHANIPHSVKRVKMHWNIYDV